MGIKVKNIGLEKDSDFVYFLDSDGDISKAKRGKGNKGTSEKVKQTKIIKEVGYLYYIDKDGDISKVEAKRGR